MSAQTLIPRASLQSNGRSHSARIVFVSTTAGDTVNDGRSPESPIASLAAAMELVGRGEANEICLRRGQTHEVAPLRVVVSGSLRITTYGIGPRPRFNCAGGAPRFEAANDAARLAIAGVDFFGSDADDVCEWPDGLRIIGRFSSVTFDDCRFQGFQCGIAANDVAALRLWRCIVADAPLGADLNCCADAIIEQCLFDAGCAGNEFIRADGVRVRGGENAVVRDCIFHGATGIALDADCFCALVQQTLFISNATHASTRGGTASLTGNVFLGGNFGPNPAGVIVRNRDALLLRNVFAQRRRNRGPAVRVEPAEDGGGVVRIREQIARGWKGECIEVCAGARAAAELCDFESSSGSVPLISLARPDLQFTALQNVYRVSPHHLRQAFRCGRTSMAFEQWRTRVSDTGSVFAARPKQTRVLLPKRLLADARFQSFTGWHARLRASVICERIRERLQPIRECSVRA